MATNSILFDFDSIIDKQISIIKFLKGEYHTIDDVNFYDKEKVAIMDDTYMQFRRMYGPEDLFKSIITDPKLKESSDNLLELLFDRDQNDIFSGGYAHKTAMTSLLTAYKRTGNGTVRTAVRCDNEYQESFIKQIAPDISIELSPRSKVDMSKYGRLVVGNYMSALQYILGGPKSILILNFRENYSDESTLLLKPELIISLGDIHDIGIISAYKEDPNISG